MKPIDIVNRAARRINLIASGDVLPSDEATDALLELNTQLSQMSLSPLLTKNGLRFPLRLGDALTGMDDQIEFALIDMLAVRLADIYRIDIPASLVQGANTQVRLLKRRAAHALTEKPNLALLNRG